MSIMEQLVAPLAGSVDRNGLVPVVTVLHRLSLPSRGAWIEIITPTTPRPWPACRSPRGERG